MTKATVKPALEKIQTDIEEIKDMIQNGNGKENLEEPMDCLCDETKEVLEQNG